MVTLAVVFPGQENVHPDNHPTITTDLYRSGDHVFGLIVTQLRYRHPDQFAKLAAGFIGLCCDIEGLGSIYEFFDRDWSAKKESDLWHPDKTRRAIYVTFVSNNPGSDEITGLLDLERDKHILEACLSLGMPVELPKYNPGDAAGGEQLGDHCG